MARAAAGRPAAASEGERETFWMWERRENNADSGPFLSLSLPLELEDYCLMGSRLSDAVEVMNECMYVAL